MKVLFIHVGEVDSEHKHVVWFPMAPCSIGAMLEKHGHQVKVFDRYAMSFAMRGSIIDRRMVESIAGFEPDMVVITAISSLIYDVVRSARIIRKGYKGKLVAVGYHATVMPECTLEKIPELDMLIEGEGEETVLRLANGEDPEKVSGVWVKKDGQLIHNPPVNIKYLNDLPFPNYNLIDMEFYIERHSNLISGYFVKSAPMLSSRGESFRYGINTEPFKISSRVRFYSAQYIVDLIEKLMLLYNVQGIRFEDTDFLSDVNRVEKICELMIGTGLNQRIVWSIKTRVERIKEPMLKELRRAGCRRIEMFIDSTDKNEAPYEKAIRVCRNHGIYTHLHVFTGLEGETEADLYEKMNWIKTVNPNTFKWTCNSPAPGTDLYNRRCDRYFETHDWTMENIHRYYDETNLSEISNEVREEWMKKNYYPYKKWSKFRHMVRVNTFKELCKILVIHISDKGIRKTPAPVSKTIQRC